MRGQTCDRHLPREEAVSGERVERRLAAILAGDIAGYSRLMDADEEGTLRTLKELRVSFLHPKVTEHRGRIVKTTGDGVRCSLIFGSTSSRRCALSRSCVPSSS